jgi:streptogramin lyase
LRALIGALAAGAFALSCAPGALAARVGSIREFALGTSAEIYLFGLAPGPDGNLWFADSGCASLGSCAIGRITPKRVITAFHRGLNAGSVPLAIATGPDGNLWFTDEGKIPAIGRVTPKGAITEFSRGLKAGSEPFEIAAGPHGDLWFTDQGRTPAIGRITPEGRITEFSRGLARGSVPFGIAVGRHRRLWFTDRGCSATGRDHRVLPRLEGGQLTGGRHGWARRERMVHRRGWHPGGWPDHAPGSDQGILSRA